MRLGIEPAKHFSGKVVRVTGRVQSVLEPGTAEGPYWMVLADLNHFDIVHQ